MASHKQVRECCQHVDLAAVVEHAAQAGFLETELPLDDAERMFTFRPDVGLLQAEAVPARAVSIRSSSRPSGVSGSARRFPGRIATRKPTALSFISSRFSIPW